MMSVGYLLILIIVFAGIGRLSIPKRERTALSSWTFRDVYFNIRRGLVVLSEHRPYCLFVDDIREPYDGHYQRR